MEKLSLPKFDREWKFQTKSKITHGFAWIMGKMGVWGRVAAKSGDRTDWKGETRLWYISTNFTTSQAPLLRFSSLLLTSLV